VPLTFVEDTNLMNDVATIFLVDPDPMMKQSIAELAEALQVTAEFFDRAEALLQTPLSSRRGCVVSEFRLHGMNGIALQETLGCVDRSLTT
jgi:FixJ family two-component response regulator